MYKALSIAAFIFCLAFVLLILVGICLVAGSPWIAFLAARHEYRQQKIDAQLEQRERDRRQKILDEAMAKADADFQAVLAAGKRAFDDTVSQELNARSPLAAFDINRDAHEPRAPKS